MEQAQPSAERERKLETQNTKLKKRNEQLEEQNRKLQQALNDALTALARARKTSATSSKPPSSDIVKPRTAALAGQSRRKIGAQPGHPRHERAPFPPSQIDAEQNHQLNECPVCGGPVRQTCVADVIQQVELKEKPTETIEHRAWGCQCERCGARHVAPFPAPVAKGGLLGPRLTALAGYLKGACHASYTTMQRFFSEILTLNVCRGYLAKLVLRKNSGALATTHQKLCARLPFQSRLNVDETGHKQNGKLFQTWCFHASRFTVFRVGLGRGSAVLVETLGPCFTGILTCDYFSAYQKFARDWDADLSFCWAHLIRDVRFLTTLPDSPTRDYGARLLVEIKAMFGCWHARQSALTRRGELLQHRAKIEGLALQGVPARSAALNLARRFQNHSNEYFRFITSPRVEPTNNAAERDERFVVIDRRITQGTRSPSGNRWCERIWTVRATCARHGQSVYNFLSRAITASFHGHPAPSLLFNSP